MESSFSIKFKSNNNFKKARIGDSHDAKNYLLQLWDADINLIESVVILTLNRAHIVTGWAKVSQGNAGYSFVDIKMITKIAIDMMADAVIIAHNHPSGELMPSSQDIKVFNRLKDALDVFGICLLDSIILSTSGHHSMKDNCELV